MAGARNSFVWYELMTSDVASAKAFYVSVLGWTTRPCDPQAPHSHCLARRNNRNRNPSCNTDTWC
jgi:predicted enzyme related to lactoylglutathione lyase